MDWVSLEDSRCHAFRHRLAHFNCSPEVIRLTVIMYIRYPLSLRQVEYMLFERGIDISEFGPRKSDSYLRCIPPIEGGILNDETTPVHVRLQIPRYA